MVDPALHTIPVQPIPVASNAGAKSWHRPSRFQTEQTDSDYHQVSVPSSERGSLDNDRGSTNTSSFVISSTIHEGTQHPTSGSLPTDMPKKSLDYRDDNRISGAELLNVDSAPTSRQGDGYFTYSAYFGGASNAAGAANDEVTDNIQANDGQMIERSAFPNPPPRTGPLSPRDDGPVPRRFDGPPALGSPRIPLPGIPQSEAEELTLAPRPAANASQNTIVYTRTPQQRERLLTASTPTPKAQTQSPPLSAQSNVIPAGSPLKVIDDDPFAPPTIPRQDSAPSPPPMLPSLILSDSSSFWGENESSTNTSNSTAKANPSILLNVTESMSSHPYASPSPTEEKITPPSLPFAEGRSRSGSNSSPFQEARNRSGSNAPNPFINNNRSGSESANGATLNSMAGAIGAGRARSGSNAPKPVTNGRNRSGSNAPKPTNNANPFALEITEDDVNTSEERGQSGSNAPSLFQGSRSRSGSTAATTTKPTFITPLPAPSLSHPYAFPSPTKPDLPEIDFEPRTDPESNVTLPNVGEPARAPAAPSIAPISKGYLAQNDRPGVTASYDYLPPVDSPPASAAPQTQGFRFPPEVTSKPPPPIATNQSITATGGGAGLGNFQFPPQKPKVTDQNEDEKKKQDSLLQALEFSPEPTNIPVPHVTFNDQPLKSFTNSDSNLDQALKTVKSSSSQSTLVASNNEHPLKGLNDNNGNATELASKAWTYPEKRNSISESQLSHGYSHSRDYSVDSLNSRTHLRFRGAGLGDGEITPDVGKEIFNQPSAAMPNQRRSLFGNDPTLGMPQSYLPNGQNQHSGGHNYSTSINSQQTRNPNHFFKLHRSGHSGRSSKRTWACIAIVVVFIAIAATVGVVVGTRGNGGKNVVLEMGSQTGTGLNGMVSNANKNVDKSGGGALGYGRVVVFGASWCDNGHERDSQYSASLAPSPPYTEGRYSNGKTWAEYLAAIIGTQAKPQASYENYAYSGAVVNNTNINGKVPDIVSQANTFIDRVKAAPAVFNTTDRTLIATWVGLNSVAAVYSEVLAGGRDHVEEGLQKAKDKLITEGVSVINAMMSIRDTPPFSDSGYQPIDILVLPIQPGETMLRHKQTAKDATSLGWDEQDALVVVKNLTETYNDVIMGQLKSYSNRKETNGRAITWDAAGTWYDIIGNPSSFAINTTDTACLVNSWACKDPENYLFWDDFHSPTTIHERIATSLQSLISTL